MSHHYSAFVLNRIILGLNGEILLLSDVVYSKEPQLIAAETLHLAFYLQGQISRQVTYVNLYKHICYT